MNRVELQNGCLALGHCNLCIPSTLHGSCFEVGNSGIDQDKLKKNLDTAIDVYLSRVGGSPCGDTQIRLYKGVQDKHHMQRRPLLLTFLRGTKDKRNDLQVQHHDLYQHFELVWSLRSHHMVPNLPCNYVFFFDVATFQVAVTQYVSRVSQVFHPLGLKVDLLLHIYLYPSQIQLAHGKARIARSVKASAVDTICQ